MSLTFKQLQEEVKRRAVKNESGTQFDSAVNNSINASIFRVAREANWRVLRRTSTFDTKRNYSTGSGSGTFTSGSNEVVITGANFLTSAIDIGRRIKISGDSYYYTIKQITSETSCNLDKNYHNTTITTTGNFEILGQEAYVLPAQVSHRMFLWHNEYGYPHKLEYVTEQDFRERGIIDTSEGVPVCYRMWGENMCLREMITEANIVYSSTALTADTMTSITIFGTVAGYPDSEVLTGNNSASNVQGISKKVYSNIERFAKNKLSTGRFILSASSRNNATNYTLGVIPTGERTSGILYKKIKLYPLPDRVFPINVYYYKDPYRLVDGGDIHELGHEFDESIILLATAKMKYEADQAEGDRFLALYSDEIRNLRKTNIDKLDFFPTLRRSNEGKSDLFGPGVSYGQVGGNYGPSSRF